MRIYLDNCSIQRPLDNKTQIRTLIEAEAVLGILSLVDSAEIELVSPEVLVFETDRNPNFTRREYALEVLAKAQIFVLLTERVQERAEEFDRFGIRPLDALHLASAEDAKADYFCTCDDRFLNRAKVISNLSIKVVTPIELIEELEK